jgi:hypothetical protein
MRVTFKRRPHTIGGDHERLQAGGQEALHTFVMRCFREQYHTTKAERLRVRPDAGGMLPTRAYLPQS